MRDPTASGKRRLRIAFFDYADVFEDFYPRYAVDQHAFATQWSGSGNHCFVRLLQDAIGDVTWYCLAVAPSVTHAVHERTGVTVKFFASSILHRLLWKAFYLPRAAWRWRSLYPYFAACASYSAPFSSRLLRALWRDRPDVIFTQDYASGKFDVLLLIARVLKIPLIAYHAGSTQDAYIGKSLKLWTISRADALLASSQKERALLIGRYRARAENVSVVLTPLDIRRYRPIPRGEACMLAVLDPNRRYFLFVGRLDDKVKRVSVLLRAFARVASEHRDVDLIITGGGEDKETLQVLAARIAPDRVRFTGWVHDEEIKIALYNAAEALVLPSRSEGFPSVVGEAMACATPVIGSDVGGISELVKPGLTGYLVMPDDEGCLAEALCAMVENGRAGVALGRNARELAERQIAEHVVAEQLRACVGNACRV